MSKESEQLSFEENWFGEHDIVNNKLEDIQFDELLLEYFSRNRQWVTAWLLENPGAKGLTPDLDWWPQALYRELICWFRESQVRIDHWLSFLEQRIPQMPEPEFEQEDGL